jgi:hypothetical protein
VLVSSFLPSHSCTTQPVQDCVKIMSCNNNALHVLFLLPFRCLSIPSSKFQKSHTTTTRQCAPCSTRKRSWKFMTASFKIRDGSSCYHYKYNIIIIITIKIIITVITIIMMTTYTVKLCVFIVNHCIESLNETLCDILI